MWHSFPNSDTSLLHLYVSFIRCDDNVEKHLILEIETLQKSQALLRQTSLNAEEEIRQMRKVKLITCFHDSWNYNFFFTKLFFFAFLQGRCFLLRSKMPIYLFIMTEKDTLQSSKKWTIRNFVKKICRFVDSGFVKKTCDELVKRLSTTLKKIWLTKRLQWTLIRKRPTSK